MAIKFPSIQRTTAMKKGFTSSDIRTLIAEHLGVEVERVTDEAHFISDLGADWLDCLELIIVIEDQFAGLEIADDHVDQIKVVGDLIRYIESDWPKPSTDRGSRQHLLGKNGLYGWFRNDGM
jgi:acyl carrier protein